LQSAKQGKSVPPDGKENGRWYSEPVFNIQRPQQRLN